jgi:hypothetical protein
MRLQPATRRTSCCARLEAPNETLPEGMDRLAEELAYELLRPVTREVRDERKG